MSSSIKTSSGEITKAVVCERCGHHYEYKMQRIGVGTVHSSKFNRAEAETEAARIAAEKLQQMLEEGCDVVPCPQCGAITREMNKARIAFFPKMLAVIGAGLGLLLLVYGAWLLTGRVYLFPSIVGAGFLFLGVFVLITGSRKMLLAGRGKR